MFSSAPELPPETWAEIFCHLEPAFLHSIFLVNHLFYQIATNNFVFNYKLRQYFPQAPAQFGDKQIDGKIVFNVEAHRFFRHLFIKKYPSQTKALTFRQAVIEEDLAYLDRYGKDKDKPFDLETLLYSPDADGKSTLSLLQKKSQTLRKLLFEKIQMFFDNLPAPDFIAFFIGPNKFSVKDPGGNYLIHWAAALNQIEFLETHFDEMRWTINGTNTKGLLPIHCSVKYGYLEATVFLLEKTSAEIFNSHPDEDPHHQRLLFLAARGNHINVARLLIASEKATFATEENIACALYVAAKNGHVKMVELLAPLVSDVDSLAIPQALASRRGTALQIACLNGHLSVVQSIFTLLPAILTTPRVRAFPIHGWLAANKGHTSIIQFLLENDPNFAKHLPNYVEQLSNILRSTVDHGQVETARFLIENGADPNIHDHRDNFCLAMAAEAGDLPMLTMLIAQGAGVNDTRHVTYNGESALHIACQQSHPPIVEALLNANCDTSLTDSSGKTALQIVEERNDDESDEAIIRLFAEHQQSNVRRRHTWD